MLNVLLQTDEVLPKNAKKKIYKDTLLGNSQMEVGKPVRSLFKNYQKKPVVHCRKAYASLHPQ